MIKTYPAIFHQNDSESGFWIEFPEFKGGTQGEDLERAMLEARDFLSSIIAYYIDEEIPLPKPSNIKDLEVGDGFASLIQAEPERYIKGNKTIRKNVTVPEWLVMRADKAKINYSETLTEALEKKLGLSA